MQTQICEEKLIEIFIAVDDFTKPFEQWLANRSLPGERQSTRQPELTASEIITLLVYYHHSGYKNFQYFYVAMVLSQMPTYFPKNWSVIVDLSNYCLARHPLCMY